MTTLAIDPGKRSGWCLIWNDKPTSGVVNGDDLPAVWGVLEQAARLAATDGITVVIEDQYHARIRGNGLTTLFRRRFAWEILARWLDLPVKIVHPMTWQSYFKIRKGDKQAIVQVARALCGYDVEQDEADAVCMAYWREA